MAIKRSNILNTTIAILIGLLSKMALAEDFGLKETYLLRKDGEDLALLVTTNTETVNPEWIVAYTHARGLQVKSIRRSPPAEIARRNSQMEDFARELQSELGEHVSVKVVKNSEMMLATQAGGRPSLRGQ